MLECIVHIELNRLYKPLEYDICDLNESSYECVFAIVKGNATRQLIQACNDLSNEKTSCDNLLIIADAGNRDIEVDGKAITIRSAYQNLENMQQKE